MLHVILAVASLGGITGPSVQGLISRNVAANEQGGVQGSLASLSSISGILGLPIAAGLFGHFARAVPGAAFFFSSGVIVLALILAVRSFWRHREPHLSSQEPPK